MQHTSLPSSLIMVLALSAGAATAQLGKVGLKIDVPARVATGNQGFLGCAFDGTDFYVSARAFPLVANNPHLLYRLDRQGNVLASYNCPCPPYQSNTLNPWGLRDLAFDGRYIYGGDESPLGYAFDTVTKMWDSTKDINKPAGVTVMRALAYDPNTDTFWTSDFGGSVFNFRRDGSTVWSGPSGATSMYGAAYDRARNKLWWFGQAGSTRPTTQVVGIEFDPVGLAPTGTEFIGDLSVPGSPAGGIAGGIDFYILPNGQFTLLCLAQATSDTIYEIGGTFVFGTSCAGGSGKVPEIGMQNDSPWLGNQNWQVSVIGVSGATNGLLFLGTNKTSFFGVPLPFDLTPIGLPNCRVNVPLTILAGTTAVSGDFASVGMPLPVDTSLSYASTFWQWLMLDPTAPNTFKLTLSTGGQTVLY